MKMFVKPLSLHAVCSWWRLSRSAAFTVIFVAVALNLSGEDNRRFYDWKIDGIYYARLMHEGEFVNQVEVKFGEGDYSGDIVIPSDIEVDGVTYTVTQIADYAFSDADEFGKFGYNRGLRSIVLPKTIYSIGWGAFRYSGVERVELNEGLYQILPSAFYSCQNLKELHLPSTLQLLSVRYVSNGRDIVRIDNLSDMHGFIWATSIERIIVSPENPYFKDIDGVVYTSDMKQLVLFPPLHGKSGNETVYRVPDGVETILQVGGEYEAMVIPASTKKYDSGVYNEPDLYFLGNNPPVSRDSLFHTDIYAEWYLSNPTIYVPKGAKETYANSDAWRTAAEKNKIVEMDMETPKKVSLTLRNDHLSDFTVNGTTETELTLDVFKPVSLSFKMKPYEVDKNGKNLIRSPKLNWCILNGNDVIADMDTTETRFSKAESNMLENRKERKYVSEYRYRFIPEGDCHFDIGMDVDNSSFTIEDEDGNRIAYTMISPTAVGVTSVRGKSDGEDAAVEISIPSAVDHEGNAFDVNSVCDNASISYVNKLNIPSSIKRIGLVRGAGSLKEISFSEGLEYIRERSFGDADIKEVSLPQSLKYAAELFNEKLKKANIPASFSTVDRDLYGLNVILDELVVDDSDLLLWKCPTAKKIILGRNTPDVKNSFFSIRDVEELIVRPSVKRIGPYSFAESRNQLSFNNGSKLKKVYVTGSGKLEIGSYAFCDTGLESFVCDPASEISIGTNAFSLCRNFTTVEFPDKVGTIGYDAFFDCRNLSNIRFPLTLDSIKHEAFINCKSMKSVTIPGNLAFIANTAFGGCTSVERVDIADGSSSLSIQNGAFADCPLKEVYVGRKIEGELPPFFRNETLERIELGSEISELAPYAFGDCKNLREIISRSPNPPKLGRGAFRNVERGKCKVIAVGGNEADYREADTWKEFFSDSGLDEVCADSGFDVRTGNGEIIIVAQRGTDVSVCRADGVLIYDGAVDTHELRIPAASGIYVVSCGSENKKIIVQ